MTATARVTRILQPTDFSPSSERALGYALLVAEATGAEVHLLHVVPCSQELPPSEKELRKAFLEAEKKLAAVAKPIDAARVVTAVRIGSAHAEVTRYVKEQRIDLVVMGTVGLSAEAHLPVGSTAERVIRAVAVPVLTVKGPVPSKASTRRCALCGAESIDVVCSLCKDRVRGEAATRHRVR
jgi:nucleotide-binding universal stress UspA family protein